MIKLILSFTLALTTLSSICQEKKWHELEGYYQSAANKDRYVQFADHDSVLLARLLWNNGEIHLMPDTGLAFVSKESDDGRPIRVVFLRDANGAVNQANVPGNGLWNRAVHYKPVVRQEMAHNPDELRPFVGLYQFKGDSMQYLQLTVDNNSLTINQLWDGGKLENFVPESKWQFFEKERPFLTLDFTLDHGGQVEQFIAFGRDLWIKKSSEGIHAAQFKSYEGTYRSKDDPDNEVRLIAADSGIVIRQLWDGKEIMAQALTNSYFRNDREQFTVQILTDQTGQVKSILLLGSREVFDKVAN